MIDQAPGIIAPRECAEFGQPPGSHRELKISIITVCFNSASTIEETIQSVAAQQYPHKEHLVIDGASTDGTVEIVRRHPSVTRWVSEADRGIYDAMNKGIAMASGEIVGTLNADDVYADDTVLSQVAEAFADCAVEACFADLVYVDKRDPDKVIRYWKSRPYQAGLFERGWMPAHPTFFVRRRIYEQFGKFDLNYPRQADFELTMRLLAVHQIRSAYIPSIWVKMRTGGASNNNVRGVIQGNLEAWRACRKNKLDVGPFFVVTKIMSRIPQWFSRP
jgi:glycosyltransferase involved in cell wall biosynthesis